MRNSLLSALLVGALGCGSGQTKSQPTASGPSPAEHQHAGGSKCPMEMAGATPVVSDTSDGVAIAFTTTGDVAALRAHVREMAERHNNMAAMHGGMGSGDMHGDMGSGDMHGKMGMHMVPSRASVEDIPGGARIVLVPNDPSQLSALRGRVREHAAMMAKGECPMMGTQPQPSPSDEHAQHHPAGT